MEPSNGQLQRLSNISFSYIPNQYFNGTDYFGWKGFDVDLFSDTPGFCSITVSPINDPPTIETIDNLEMDANAELDIFINAQDVDNDSLIYDFIISENANYSFNPVNQLLTIIPNLN